MAKRLFLMLSLAACVSIPGTVGALTSVPIDALPLSEKSKAIVDPGSKMAAQVVPVQLQQTNRQQVQLRIVNPLREPIDYFVLEPGQSQPRQIGRLDAIKGVDVASYAGLVWVFGSNGSYFQQYQTQTAIFQRIDIVPQGAQITPQAGNGYQPILQAQPNLDARSVADRKMLLETLFAYERQRASRTNPTRQGLIATLNQNQPSVRAILADCNAIGLTQSHDECKGADAFLKAGQQGGNQVQGLGPQRPGSLVPLNSSGQQPNPVEIDQRLSFAATCARSSFPLNSPQANQCAQNDQWLLQNRNFVDQYRASGQSNVATQPLSLSGQGGSPASNVGAPPPGFYDRMVTLDECMVSRWVTGAPEIEFCDYLGRMKWNDPAAYQNYLAEVQVRRNQSGGVQGEPVSSGGPTVTGSPAVFPEAASWGGIVRAGPSMESERIGSLAEGESITLLRNTGVDMNGYPWFEIGMSNGQTGYQWGGIICGRFEEIPGTYLTCN